MAFLLTPRFAPAYHQPCNSWSCAPAPRPQYVYRRASRPSIPEFVPFLSQVGDLLSELDREARREAYRQRQLRKRIFRAHFNVHGNEEGYQIDGDLPGFEQDSIEIEVTDAHTLRVSGKTERNMEQRPQVEADTKSAPAPASEPVEPVEKTQDEPVLVDKAQDESMQEATTNDAEKEVQSDTASTKSYQATVEDDFEDLGAETSSTVSASSSASAPAKTKGKGKAVDEPTSTTTETAVLAQPQPEAPVQQQQQHSEDDTNRFRESFERTFRFPERIDAGNVRASLRNGLLSITVPKEKAPERRKIIIQ